MEITIDEAMKYLRALKRCETCEESVCKKSCECYRIGSSAKCYDAIDVGVDTMRKFQQLQADYEAKLGAMLEELKKEIEDTGAYEQEINGKTEFLKGINYCLGVIDKYKSKSEPQESEKT